MSHANLLFTDVWYGIYNWCDLYVCVCCFQILSGCYFLRDASAACKEEPASSSDYCSTQLPQSRDDLSSSPPNHWPSEQKSLDAASQRFSYPRCTLSEAPAKPMPWPKWFWNDQSQSGVNLVTDFILRDETEPLENYSRTDEQLSKDSNCSYVRHGTILCTEGDSLKSDITAAVDNNLRGTPMKSNQEKRRNSLCKFDDVFLSLPPELSPVISILRVLEVRFHDLLLEFDDPMLCVNLASLGLDEALACITDAVSAVSKAENHLKKSLSRLQQGLLHLDQALVELNEILQGFTLQVLQLLKGDMLHRELGHTAGVLIQAVEQFNETVPMLRHAMHQLTQFMIQFHTVTASMSSAAAKLDGAIRSYGQFVTLLSKTHQDMDETIPALRNVSNFRNALLRLHETTLRLIESLAAPDKVVSQIPQIVTDVMRCHPELILTKRQLRGVLLPHLKCVVNCLENALQPLSQNTQKLVRLPTLRDAYTDICPPSIRVLIEAPHQGFIVLDCVTAVPPVANLNLSGSHVWQNGHPVALQHSKSSLDFGQTTQQFSRLKQDLCQTALRMNKPVLVIDRIINELRSELPPLGDNLPELDKATASLEQVVVHFASFKHSTDVAFPKLRVTLPKLESVLSEFAANTTPFNQKLVQLDEDRKHLGISSKFQCSPSAFAVYQPIGFERSLGKTLHDITSSDSSSSGSSVVSGSSSPTIEIREKRVVFLAKVLIGRYAQGRPDYVQPPLLDYGFPLGKRYDSCVDDSDHPAIFVTFNPDQCYPLYLIEYTTN